MDIQPDMHMKTLFLLLATSLPVIASDQAAPLPEMIDLGDHKLEIVRSGTGTPTVVFEVGIGGNDPVLKSFVTKVGTSALFYNRAGHMNSEAARDRRTPDDVSEELHTLLQRAKVPPPYILVGHSAGGLYVRIFAIKFPSEVAGLVLIDPVHERQHIEWRRVDPEADARTTAALGARLSPSGKAELAGAIQGVMNSGTLGVSAKLPDVPMIVITSVRPGPSIPPTSIKRALHADIFQSTTNGMHIVTSKASHLIPNDDPDLVLNAIAWVLNTARKQAPESVAQSAAERIAVQPLEWIIRETATMDEWAYIAPDGESITFSRSRDGGKTFELLVTNRVGRTPRPFLIKSPAASVTRAAWSRQHRRLAFTAGTSEDRATAIYVADENGEKVERVSGDGLSDRVKYPSWMPDGESLVVVDYGAPGGSALYRLNIRTGKTESLTSPKEFMAGMPSVSPDGKLIAFAGQRKHDGDYDQTMNQIWLLPLDGRPRQVSHGQGRQPDWSPDGKWLAFTSTRGNAKKRQAVFIVDRDGEMIVRLTEYGTNASHPVWSPDGRWIVVAAQEHEGGPWGLAYIRVAEVVK